MGPSIRDVCSHNEHILLERNHLSCQQVSHPRNPLHRVFCPTHYAQGMGHPKATPRDHIPVNSPDSQVPLSAMDKLNLSRWLCLVKPRNPLSHCSMCPFTPQVAAASEKEGLSGKELNSQKKDSASGCSARWVFKASITRLSTTPSRACVAE